MMHNIHWLLIVILYILYVPLYFSLFIKKLKGDGIDIFINKFQSTFLDRHPALLRATYKFFAFLELGVVILYLISFLKLEFSPHHSLTFVNLALILQLFIMSLYACGHALIQDFKGIVTVWAWTSVILLFLILLNI